MKNKLIEYDPHEDLKKYIDGYWSFRNTSGEKIYFPVVPDGCSDIIFYLNDSLYLGNVKETFVTGVMEQAQLIPILEQMEIFGIRFKPSVLSYLLDVDFSNMKNDMVELHTINSHMSKVIVIDRFANDEKLAKSLDEQLMGLCNCITIDDHILDICIALEQNPNAAIQNLAKKYNYTLKNLQRMFYKRIGIPPKVYARIMRFQKAHRQITKEGIEKLIFIALDSGYFDQAHFNREYKKLVGTNPSNETMSILYNT